MEMYPRGRRGGFAKALGGATCAEVRILSSPPYEKPLEIFREVFLFPDKIYHQLTTICNEYWLLHYCINILFKILV